LFRGKGEKPALRNSGPGRLWVGGVKEEKKKRDGFGGGKRGQCRRKTFGKAFHSRKKYTQKRLGWWGGEKEVGGKDAEKTEKKTLVL